MPADKAKGIVAGAAHTAWQSLFEWGFARGRPKLVVFFRIAVSIRVRAHELSMQSSFSARESDGGFSTQGTIALHSPFSKRHAKAFVAIFH